MRARTFVPLILAIGFAPSAGCGSPAKASPDADMLVGRVCELALIDASAVATIDVELECPSRLCLLPTNETATDTVATCTAACTGDSDCDGAETRSQSDPNDRRCRGRFICAVAETVGDFCCRKLCMCEDFFATKPTAIPSACEPTDANRASCPNI